ncbi:uncharacterized protein DUF3108 [Trinickia symbiotica]|uniref:DUF3108 domain-containing protein n=1 Tax=Trinickia symbiotica TaxID=863227 RepID=A0A2N7X4N1_9BURK|nr:DUF3108 domain-containing protein [Trinickia symbiotica]PMS36564.1 DUF3108 domain-containing protein [Trinickia symbiotica]PPK44387.1 uncharacterized protein DUF3108 [Trinickia symbiotica]
MPSAFTAADPRTTPVARSAGSGAARWCAVLAVVLIVHGIVGIWFSRERETATPSAEKPPVEIELLRPQRISREPTHEAANPSRPAVPAAKKPGSASSAEPVLRAIAPHAPPAPPSAPVEASAPPAASAALAANGTGTAASGSATAGETTSAAKNASGAAGRGVKFSTPPSGELRYETFYNGVRNAPGTIHWASDGSGYTMVVSVPLPFVGTYTYVSEGHIDAFGLAPQRYIETRGRRGQDVTTFDRAAGHIAFTRTPSTLPLANGAQDRFSVIMQLASLVKGDPDAYQPGVTREFYVADNDSGELWPIETIGDETVRTPAGFVEARHFMRLPRRAGDARRIDVWLAPALGWLPARIMQTEPNGAQIELVWGGALAAPGAENATSSVRPDNSSDNGFAPQPSRVEP